MLTLKISALFDDSANGTDPITVDYISDLLSQNGSKLLQLYCNYIPSHALDSIFVK